MADATVRVIAGRSEVTLGDEPRVVPAAQVVISVAGAASRNVTLDGRAVRLSSGDTGVFAIDLVRSTGFHHLIVDGKSFWFGTTDAKLGLDGVVAMLDHLATMGTGWTGQAMFSSGAGLRDPHVSYGWLDQWADQALTAVATVIETPRSQSTSQRVLRRRGGAGVLLAPTLRLLRSDPQRYLTSRERGLLSIDGQQYDPLRVVARHRTSTLDTIANRRAIAILSWIVRLGEDVMITSTNADAVARARLWTNQAQALLRRPLAQSLGQQQLGGQPQQPEEVTESAYGVTYRVAADLEERFGWSASVSPQSRLSYVEHSDVIYQAYVASRLAQALDMHQTSPVLGAQQPAFVGSRFDLYYDTQPPRSVLRSWRQSSDSPDRSRPDLLLHDRDAGAVAVLDAKYRRTRDGGASEDSRKDMSAYMSLYGLSAVTILYPGSSSSVTAVAGKGQRIVEAAVSPAVGDLAAVVDVILTTLAKPRY